MNKIIRKQLNKKSLCSSRGFSLVETLITVLLLLIVSSLAAMAISFGTVEYKKSMNQSLAQMLYSTLETALESHLQYADETNANYVLQDGMLYLESGTELKPVLEKAAYTDLNLKNFDLNYDSAKHCFTVNFSVCSGDDVIIDGDNYSFDVFSLPSMLGFSVGVPESDSDSTAKKIQSAKALISHLNQNIYDVDSGFLWDGKDGWNNGSHNVKSIGKALVSGAKGKPIKDAFATLGDTSAAAKYYGLINPVEFVSLKPILGEKLASLSGATNKYKSLSGAYAIVYQTKEYLDALGKNSTYEVTVYFVAECKRKSDDPDKQKYGETGYTIIGVRETEIRTNGAANVIITADDYDINNWTPVPW